MLFSQRRCFSKYGYLSCHFCLRDSISYQRSTSVFMRSRQPIKPLMCLLRLRMSFTLRVGWHCYTNTGKSKTNKYYVRFKWLYQSCLNYIYCKKKTSIGAAVCSEIKSESNYCFNSRFKLYYFAFSVEI